MGCLQAASSTPNDQISLQQNMQSEAPQEEQIQKSQTGTLQASNRVNNYSY